MKRYINNSIDTAMSTIMPSLTIEQQLFSIPRSKKREMEYIIRDAVLKKQVVHYSDALRLNKEDIQLIIQNNELDLNTNTEYSQEKNFTVTESSITSKPNHSILKEKQLTNKPFFIIKEKNNKRVKFSVNVDIRYTTVCIPENMPNLYFSQTECNMGKLDEQEPIFNRLFLKSRFGLQDD